jgi:hypothetical protein
MSEDRAARVIREVGSLETAPTLDTLITSLSLTL